MVTVGFEKLLVSKDGLHRIELTACREHGRAFRRHVECRAGSGAGPASCQRFLHPPSFRSPNIREHATSKDA